MVGSYAPKLTAQSYTTPLEDAPSGMTGRGTYHVNSLFTDDDKNEHLKVTLPLAVLAIRCHVTLPMLPYSWSFFQNNYSIRALLIPPY